MVSRPDPQSPFARRPFPSGRIRRSKASNPTVSRPQPTSSDPQSQAAAPKSKYSPADHGLQPEPEALCHLDDREVRAAVVDGADVAIAGETALIGAPAIFSEDPGTAFVADLDVLQR